MSDRLDTIRARLMETFSTNIRCSLSIVPPNKWHGMGGTAPFGFMWPILLDDEIVLPVCFEVFSESTDWLDDESLDMYLDIIEFQISRHIVYLGRDGLTDLDARIKQVDDDLYDLRRDAMRFLSDLQMTVLDNGGAP